MKPKGNRLFASFIASALLLPTLAACGTGSLDGPATPTPVPAAQCVTSLVTTAALPTPEGTVTIPPTPTTGTASDAPAYSELEVKLEALRKILANITTPDQYQQQQAEIDKAWQELNDAWATVGGKTIKGWQGWIIATGQDAITMGQHMGLEVSESVMAEHAVLITLSNPFTATAASSQAKARGMMTQSYAAPEPFIVINNPLTVDNKALCLGQKVTIEGIATKTINSFEKLGVFLQQATVTVAEDKLGDLKPAAGLDDVAVRFERTMCFGFCPDYSVTVYGNGVVLFHGRYHTKVQGFRIETVDQATVQKLIDALDAAKFDTMPSYTNYEVTDMPSAAITLVRAGNTHRVDHYQGDSKAPEALVNLENKIDEILNTARWTQ